MKQATQTIIDKEALCEIFGISESTLRSQYKSWPHFYVCKGRDLRSARFVLEKVVEHLENADERQETGNVDRPGSKSGVSSKKKTGIHNKSRSRKMGNRRSGSDLKSGSDPFDLYSVFN